MSAKFVASKYHLLALMLLGTLINVHTSWNLALRAGFGFELIFNAFAAVSFIFHCASMSELTSTLPFPGGAYGLARCTVGFFFGYLVGCFELFYYLLNFSMSNGTLVTYISTATPSTDAYIVPMVILAFVSQACVVSNKKVFWTMLVVIAIYLVVINIIFIFGAIPHADFTKWAYSRIGANLDQGGITFDDDIAASGIDDDSPVSLFIGKNIDVVHAVPPCLWIYMGFEFVNLACDDCDQPRKDIPFAQMIGVILLVIFNTTIPILAVSMSPGSDELVRQVAPTLAGFSQILGIGRHHALYVILPATYGYSTTLLYVISKLFASMAESKLFPSVLAQKFFTSEVPLYSIILAAVLGFIVILVPALGGRNIALVWGNIMGVLGFTTYLIQLYGFWVLRKFLTPLLGREFRSPFGIPGAFFSFAMILFGLGCSFVSGMEALTTFSVVIVYVGAMVIYYELYAGRVQTFSDAERSVIMPAHVGVKDANAIFRNRYSLFGDLAFDPPVHIRPSARHMEPGCCWNTMSRVLPNPFASMLSTSEGTPSVAPNNFEKIQYISENISMQAVEEDRQ